MTDFIAFDDLPHLSLKHREPFLFLERGNISVDDGGLVVLSEMGATQIPVGGLTALLLEPGVSITHEAIKVCGKTQTFVAWVSEAGTRLYAAGSTGHGPGPNKERQIRAWASDGTRRLVARRMFAKRFGEEPGEDKDLNQLRGLEGIRVRAMYRVLAKQAGIVWRGRNYDPANFHEGDAVNQALSSANACLYAVTEAAVLAAGYDPTLGFLHAGSQTSFVQDIADLYKFETSVPLAMRVAGDGDTDITNRVRRASRDVFRRKRIVDRIIKDLDPLFEGL